MEEIIRLLLKLFSELASIRAQIQDMKKSKIEAFRDTWVDAQEVMQMLHISPRTLQTYREKGILPFSKVRGKIFYKLSSIESLLDKYQFKNDINGTN